MEDSVTYGTLSDGINMENAGGENYCYHGARAETSSPSSPRGPTDGARDRDCPGIESNYVINIVARLHLPVNNIESNAYRVTP